MKGPMTMKSSRALLLKMDPADEESGSKFFNSSFLLAVATFSLLTGHICLVVIILDITNTEHVHPYGKCHRVLLLWQFYS